MTKVSAAGDKLFVEYSNNSSIIPFEKIENISHDNIGSVTLSGSLDPHFFYSIYVETELVEPPEIPKQPTVDQVISLYKDVLDLVKSYHSTRKISNAKAYIKPQ